MYLQICVRFIPKVEGTISYLDRVWYRYDATLECRWQEGIFKHALVLSDFFFHFLDFLERFPITILNCCDSSEEIKRIASVYRMRFTLYLAIFHVLLNYQIKANSILCINCKSAGSHCTWSSSPLCNHFAASASFRTNLPRITLAQ